jgi:RNA polymerase sigma factor (sigma-70 family)
VHAGATHDLYERYSRQVFGFCVNQLGSRDEAEDAVQSTFLNAHRALQRGVTPEAELAWLFKIAHNVCLTRRRSTRRRGRVEAASDLQAMQDIIPAPARESADELIRLTDALSHMPDNQRRAILLREWQGLSYHEIAEELKLSQSAVETLIFRARRSLAANLEVEPERPSMLARAKAALDIGSLLTLAKALFEGGAAVKVAAAAVAVSGAAVVATGPPQSTRQAPHPVVQAPAAVVTDRSDPQPAVSEHRAPSGVVVPAPAQVGKRAGTEKQAAVVAESTEPAPVQVEVPVVPESAPAPAAEAPAPSPPAAQEHGRADKPVKETVEQPKAEKPNKADRPKKAGKHDAGPAPEPAAPLAVAPVTEEPASAEPPAAEQSDKKNKDKDHGGGNGKK